MQGTMIKSIWSKHTLLCSIPDHTLHCSKSMQPCTCTQLHFETERTWPQFTATVGIVPFWPPCLSCSRTLCLISLVTLDLHCWETVSGGRQARKRAATVTRLSIVTLIGVYTHNLLSSTLYVLQTQFWTDSQTNCSCLYFCTYHLSLLRSCA